jgi:hypothetical protein
MKFIGTHGTQDPYGDPSAGMMATSNESEGPNMRNHRGDMNKDNEIVSNVLCKEFRNEKEFLFSYLCP